MKKKILVSVDAGETRVAVFEQKGNAKSRVAELYVERRGSRSIVGNIYKGVVDNVLPGMEAAFVDIGLERNGFLHVDEIVLPGGEKVPRRGHGKGRRIDELIKPKQEVLVQVVKDPLKTKGARLSMQLSIAGRYLVYMPQGAGVGASRRLPDNERDRQRKLLHKIHKGKGGVIVRTAAQGAQSEDFERDLAYLHKLAEVVERRGKEVKGPDLVFQEADLSIRVLRDVLPSEFDKAVIDDPKQHQRVTSFFQRTAPELVSKVETYDGAEPLFEREGAEQAVRSTLTRRVDLPSGGYLMIDYAEALTVIDINTGSFTGRGKGRLEDTITKVNIEAAEEVVRQLRLRDIGGIIVVDFIDMARARNRDQVLKTMREALDEDKTKTYVVEISPLGLVEMTRQNVTDGVREILTKTCPTCEGEGVILSEETVAIDVIRKLRELVAQKPEPEAFLIRVNPRVAGKLTEEGSGLVELEKESGKDFHFEGGEALAVDTYEVSDEGTREDIERMALPFAVGDEVLVTIEEPHMYEADDAIARVDSYIVSVTGGGKHVGERRLVRIDGVARSQATASLVDTGSENGADGESEAPAGGDDESPPRRRRGNRGGRGRSGERDESASAT
ncbi:MAG: ribonuclease [Solirubrobacterales bacterium]|nr:ribonuclease [Solirubrobacterales bacterium]